MRSLNGPGRREDEGVKLPARRAAGFGTPRAEENTITPLSITRCDAAAPRRAAGAARRTGPLALLWLLAAALAGCATAPGPSSSAAPSASARTAAEVARQAETQRQIDAQRQAEFNKSLDRWHGASVKELLAKLGKPNATAHEPDGTRVYIYARSTQTGAQGGALPFTCVVRYLIDEKAGKVVGHRIEGC
jgi:hypothetical protein